MFVQPGNHDEKLQTASGKSGTGSRAGFYSVLPWLTVSAN
jgi:hypothetical protein